MKKALLILSILAVAIGAKAQGNLQFNQVITGAASLSIGANSGLLTVPANKVWKIEAVNMPAVTGMQMQINSIGTSIGNCIFPFWLKAGNTFSVFNGATSAAYSIQYSIIEFNIIP